MLTARREEIDEVVGLELGADDCIPKQLDDEPPRLIRAVRGVSYLLVIP